MFKFPATNLVSAEEAATLLGVSLATLEEWDRNGLPRFGTGKRRRYLLAQLIRWATDIGVRVELLKERPLVLVGCPAQFACDVRPYYADPVWWFSTLFVCGRASSGLYFRHTMVFTDSVGVPQALEAGPQLRPVTTDQLILIGEAQEESWKASKYDRCLPGLSPKWVSQLFPKKDSDGGGHLSDDRHRSRCLDRAYTH
jgi:hypothetical protein